MASLTQWTWVWANSGRWWRTGKPGVLQSMWSQRVRQDLATEQEYSTLKTNCKKKFGSTFQGPDKQTLLMMTWRDNADYRALPAPHQVLMAAQSAGRLSRPSWSPSSSPPWPPGASILTLLLVGKIPGRKEPYEVNDNHLATTVTTSRPHPACYCPSATKSNERGVVDLLSRKTSDCTDVWPGTTHPTTWTKSNWPPRLNIRRTVGSYTAGSNAADLSGADATTTEIKQAIAVMHLNHPETTQLPSMENWLPWNRALGPRMGTTAI